MKTKREGLYICCVLFVVAALGCAGPRIVMEPADVQVFIDDARDSVSLAQEAGAYEMAPEQMARAESLLARAEEAVKDEKRGAESIRLASEARAKAEVAHAVSRQEKLHQQELQRISSEKASELAALRIAQEAARKAEEEKAEEAQECARKLEQLQRDKERELATARADLKDAEDKADRAEQELAAATSRWESAMEELEEALAEADVYSEKTAEMEKELANARAALGAAEGDVRETEAKARKYSERVAALEREKDKKIAIHVAREEATQKKAARAEARKEILSGEASLETLEKVRKAIEGWRLAWVRKDAARYASYYADDAQIKKLVITQGKEEVQGLSKSEMRREMEQFFASGMKFNMEGPRLEAGSHAVRATFEFFKEVPPGVYTDRSSMIKHDKWIKELLFREAGEEWKIVREDWSIYHGIPEYAER